MTTNNTKTINNQNKSMNVYNQEKQKLLSGSTRYDEEYLEQNSNIVSGTKTFYYRNEVLIGVTLEITTTKGLTVFTCTNNAEKSFTQVKKTANGRINAKKGAIK